MENLKEMKARDKRLSTKDFARADERRDLGDESQPERDLRDDRLAEMDDRNPEGAPTKDARALPTDSRPAERDDTDRTSMDMPLMKVEDEEDFRSRWKTIQAGFVDEPRGAVEQADELVAELMQHLARSFSDQRSGLETQWQRSEEVSTEELRGALRRYRSFFDRLLSI
jgi:hypothetical protein